MIVYKSSKQGFVSDVFNGVIADEIDDAFFLYLGRHTSPNEKASWKNSMMHMFKVVDTPEIPDDAEIAIEYQIPLTSKRIDFIIAGVDDNNKGNIIIIELKQWETAKLSPKSGIISTRFQYGEHEVAHPSYQAWSYAETLHNFNETIRDYQIVISPCAFLHNYEQDDVIGHYNYAEYIQKAPLFLKRDASQLRDFIKSRIKYGTKDGIIWMIDNGKLKPSKQLADALSSMLKGNKEFILLDDQKVVYETAISMARTAQKENSRKQVLIVEGGPGTGKSVVAINLLVNLTNLGIATQYVSKNSAPRSVYTAKLTGDFKRTYINNLFTGSGAFVDAPENIFGALIVDEAHRLNEKSGLFSNLGENQILEIIRASHFSVFFVDDRQRIHIKDIGSKQYIKQIAEKEGANVYITQLSSQFRCNGSDGYLSWLDNALQIKETANINLTTDDYDFRIFSSPNELFNAIVDKNRKNNKSRVVAGYCWDWVSKNDLTKYDIVFPKYNFKKQWNLNSANTPWLIGQDSVNQIGCIHTCQGLELDYVGVIIGNDLRFTDKVITDVTKRSINDQSVKGFKQRLRTSYEQALQDADEIIKNTYRTLMTRGMKGCYVYFCDKRLENHFKSLIGNTSTLPKNDNYRIEPVVNDEVKFVDFLPLYSIKAACGYFGEGENVEEEGWMKVEGLGKLNRNMYIVQAIGDSMEPTISDGDYCVFRSNPAGSRQGKIILAQHHSKYDPDYSGSYSIKVYSSSKKFDENGIWMHEEIMLHPKNKAYNPIIINEEDSEEFRIVGEYVGKINMSD